mmetsp:Transcript_18412/g.60199  ORF Transcript_18412/g.60199 Transcript_18412/m.60199 type:complete len:422 (+) Transcript_18412:900-2165(+)
MAAPPRNFGGGTVGGAPAPGPAPAAAPAPAVSDESVAVCVEMGFDAASARTALAASGGDVEAAISLLASGAIGPDISPAAPPPAVAAPAAEVLRVDVPADSGARLAAAHEAASLLAADGAAAAPALGLLSKLVANVLGAPAEPKYRKVRLSNPKIAAALGASPAAHALLQLCGFRLAEGGDFAELAEVEAADTGALEECAALLAQAEEWATHAEAGPSDVRVFFAPDGAAAARPADLGDDFYRLTADDAREMVAAASARREREGVLQTRAAREAEAARRRRRYRKASVRVRLPDGTMLQATFAVSSPVGRLLSWVEESLREPGVAFELAVPRGAPLSDPTATIEAAQLAPAALLHFKLAAGEEMAPPFLAQRLLDEMRPLDEAGGAVPRGEGGLAPPQPPPAGAGAAAAGEPRAPPRWAPH